MGQEPQTSPKRYVSDLFEKSLHVIVTYLGKIVSKLRFPEGGSLLVKGGHSGKHNLFNNLLR